MTRETLDFLACALIVLVVLFIAFNLGPALSFARDLAPQYGPHMVCSGDPIPHCEMPK
ncbi:hypothetical protein [Ketogulonicigenium vulgare]|uniref:hypothetical protein n=1 Tax=Ketogulonicigenium vulgare TaxID=92945 RepID=UPI00235963F6|nr:hypothetical protein [Ketogulonicigenium vulgare]